MFSSIRARLWLSYAALIVAALGVVAIVLVIFLLRNPSSCIGRPLSDLRPRRTCWQTDHELPGKLTPWHRLSGFACCSSTAAAT